MAHLWRREVFRRHIEAEAAPEAALWFTHMYMETIALVRAFEHKEDTVQTYMDHSHNNE